MTTYRYLSALLLLGAGLPVAAAGLAQVNRRVATTARFAPAPADRAPDLTRIDRRIAKEPAYRSKEPRYCLPVFGPEAKTRVWLVFDGDTLYADVNGNGDLTEAGERGVADRNGCCVVGDIVVHPGTSADERVRGGGGNDKMVGGAGDDILLGEAGDDDLVGSDGRDLLFGGLGADRLVASSADDVLVSGVTDHDND